MYLNTLQPAIGAKFKPKKLGRGIGSGLGKTCGKGHKGQKARAGGYHKVGFEGGQTPYKRKVPKFGFTSITSLVTAELRLSDLHKVAKLPENVNQNELHITFDSLKRANLINNSIKKVKIIATGKVQHLFVVTLSNAIKLTAGAKQQIESFGGRVLSANV